MTTTPSFLSQSGISINVDAPLFNSIGLTGLNVTSQVSSYEHIIAALGGYESARFALKLTQNAAEDWFVNGLGREVTVYNSALVKIWEGFVDLVELAMGPLSISRGPLSTVVNRCSAIYGLLDTTQNPPVQTLQLPTTIAQNATSQARWGIWEQILSAGQTTTVDAESMRDAYLAEYANPETSQELSPGAGRPTSVVINCRGYQDFLDAGIYTQVVNSGTTQLETKLAAVLDDAGADPNTLFASTNAEIFTSGILVQQYEDESLKARAIINGMVALGDGTAANGRMLWGIYNDRRFTYSQVPTTVAYQQRLSSQAQRVETSSGAIVQPWDVRPGRWIFFPDFLTGHPQPATLRDDNRHEFIERVQYTAPFGLTLTGSKVSSLPQILARAGLGGFR